ncbi:MAG TPA: HutD family protein [Gammaproteobacteria bacterium]|nr:HutD family protein [Gammaproteobacteria bacterium]
MSGPRLSARLLAPADYKLMPWKNGRGATTELAIHPAHADLAERPFDWRLSMADVVEDGDFSSFPGYDRTLVVTRGEGMELTFDGAAAPQRLAGPGHAASFSGDWATRGRLLGGPVRDFNVMSARERLHHECEVIAGAPVEFVWEPGLETLFCHCIAGNVALKMRGNAEWQLVAEHSLWLPESAGHPGFSQLMVMPHSRDTLAVVARLRRL